MMLLGRKVFLTRVLGRELEERRLRAEAPTDGAESVSKMLFLDLSEGCTSVVG